MLTVKELREQLATMPDTAVVVLNHNEDGTTPVLRMRQTQTLLVTNVDGRRWLYQTPMDGQDPPKLFVPDPNRGQEAVEVVDVVEIL